MRAPFLHKAASFEELWSEVDFATFPIPEHFNLGVACVDDQDSNATALTVVAKDETSTTYTFGDVKERANRLANALTDLGVSQGDVVAIVNPASLETAVAFMEQENSKSPKPLPEVFLAESGRLSIIRYSRVHEAR